MPSWRRSVSYTHLPGVDVESANGQIIVRSPTLFRSYRHEARPRIIGSDGRDDWFPTGDAGDVANGRVTVRGRLGYVINTGGEKIWPEDLETIIASVPGVEDVAVPVSYTHLDVYKRQH